MAPVSGISSTTRYKVTSKGNTITVTIAKDNNAIFTIGSYVVKLSKKQIKMDTKVTKGKDGKAYAQLKYIAQALNYKIDTTTSNNHFTVRVQ